MLILRTSFRGMKNKWDLKRIGLWAVFHIPDLKRTEKRNYVI